MEKRTFFIYHTIFRPKKQPIFGKTEKRTAKNREFVLYKGRVDVLY